MKSYCSSAWPLFKLGVGKWPKTWSLDYNAILQLDLCCHKMGKWTEVPCVQAFMALDQTLFCAAPVLGESQSTPNILDNPF